MHCRNFVEPGLDRRDLLLRCGAGFGALALAALFREPAFGARIADAPAEHPKRSQAGGRQPARVQALAFSTEGAQRHFSVHGRRTVAGRHVRPQASA